MTTKSHKTNPADKVEQWPIDKLIPYAKNSRTHSEEQVAQIAASIQTATLEADGRTFDEVKNGNEKAQN